MSVSVSVNENENENVNWSEEEKARAMEREKKRRKGGPFLHSAGQAQGRGQSEAEQTNWKVCPKDCCPTHSHLLFLPFLPFHFSLHFHNSLLSSDLQSTSSECCCCVRDVHCVCSDVSDDDCFCCFCFCFCCDDDGGDAYAYALLMFLSVWLNEILTVIATAIVSSSETNVSICVWMKKNCATSSFSLQSSSSFFCSSSSSPPSSSPSPSSPPSSASPSLPSRPSSASSPALSPLLSAVQSLAVESTAHSERCE